MEPVSRIDFKFSDCLSNKSIGACAVSCLIVFFVLLFYPSKLLGQTQAYTINPQQRDFTVAEVIHGSLEADKLRKQCLLQSRFESCSTIIRRQDEKQFATKRTIAVAYYKRGELTAQLGDLKRALRDHRIAAKLHAFPKIDDQISRLEQRVRAIDRQPDLPANQQNADALIPAEKSDQYFWATETQKVIHSSIAEHPPNNTSASLRTAAAQDKKTEAYRLPIYNDYEPPGIVYTPTKAVRLAQQSPKQTNIKTTQITTGSIPTKSAKKVSQNKLTNNGQQVRPPIGVQRDNEIQISALPLSRFRFGPNIIIGQSISASKRDAFVWWGTIFVLLCGVTLAMYFSLNNKPTKLARIPDQPVARQEPVLPVPNNRRIVSAPTLKPHSNPTSRSKAEYSTPSEPEKSVPPIPSASRPKVDAKPVTPRVRKHKLGARDDLLVVLFAESEGKPTTPSSPTVVLDGKGYFSDKIRSAEESITKHEGSNGIILASPDNPDFHGWFNIFDCTLPAEDPLSTEFYVNRIIDDQLFVLEGMVGSTFVRENLVALRHLLRLTTMIPGSNFQTLLEVSTAKGVEQTRRRNPCQVNPCILSRWDTNPAGLSFSRTFEERHGAILE